MDNRGTDNQFNNRMSPEQNQASSAPPPPNEVPQQTPTDSLHTNPQFTYNTPAPKKRRKLKALLVLLVLALIGASAWYVLGRSDEQQSAPVAEDKSIELLKVGIEGADYGALYPETAPSSYSTLVNAQIFEGLVRYEEKSKLVPLLATDWSNPDSETWVFNLKQGVKFHTGNVMTAKDVKYSIDKMRNLGSDYGKLLASTITKVETVSDSQVRIITDGADPTLLNKLSFLYIIDSNAPKDSEPSLAGTGPYILKPGTTPTKQHISMVAYDGYHGAAATTKAVEFGHEKNSEELVKAFEAGKYNIVGNVAADVADSRSDTPQFITSEPEVAFLGLNSVKKGPLQNKKVREAIRYAVDSAALAEAGGSKVTPVSQVVPESLPGYNPAITPYERDVDKAKQLLKEAGYPNGVTIQFTYSPPPDELAVELKKQLKEAGIELKVDLRPDFDDFIDFFLSGQAEMYYVIYSSDVLDGLEVYEANLAPENYKNSELDAVLKKARASVDPAERLKLLQDASVIVDQDVAIVPLSTQDTIWLMDQDYDIQQDMPSSFLSVYVNKVQLK